MHQQSTFSDLIPTDEEIHYLWYYFITASIMVPHVRRRLRRAWGFCERHAWVVLMVEASLRNSFLMGPAVLYNDILGRASRAFDMTGPLKQVRLLASLHSWGACPMCAMKLKPAQRRYAGKDLIERSRDSVPIVRFAQSTREHWDGLICGVCRGDDSPMRCRRHLTVDLWRGAVKNMDEHRDALEQIGGLLAAYGRSCRWEHRGTDTPEDRAGVLAAVGWCSGWRPLLHIVDG